MAERCNMRITSKYKMGFGVPEALVALAILGISALGLYQFMGGIEKIVYRTEQMGEMEGVLDQVSDSARKVLTNIGSSTSPTDGVCRFMTLRRDTLPINSIASGVMDIDLALFRTVSNGIVTEKANIDALTANPPKTTVDMWSSSFDSTKWTAVPACWPDLGGSSNQLGRYQRCYTPVTTAWPEIGDVAKLNSKEIRVQVSLTPVKLNAIGTSLISTANNLEIVPPPTAGEPLKRVNARDHGFLITSKISWKSASKVEIRTHYNVVWAGEFTCLYGTKTNGQKIYLNPSGIGSGSKSATAIEIFSANHNLEEVKVEWLDTTYSVAKIESIAGDKRAVTLSGPDGGSWSDGNDHRASFTAACQERSFKCKKSASARSWGPLITLNTLIRYRNSIAQNSNPSLSFRRPTGPTSFQTLTPGTDLGSTVSYFVNTSDPNQHYYTAATNTLLLSRGLPSFGMQVNNAGAMCTNLCTNENKPEWHAYLNLGSGMDYSDPQNVGCVCCTMKQCAAVGNKSAACASQPIEPADARVPECDSVDSIETAKTINLNAPAANQCVVVKRNAAKTALEFYTRPCTDANPYVCYAAGRYFIPKAGANPVAGAFSGANQSCYSLGLQSVAIAELTELLTQQGNLGNPARLPPSNYYDSGMTGIFLAPQSENMQTQVLALMNATFTNASEEVWIGLQTSAAGRGIATAPLISAVAHNANAGWVAYYDNNFTIPHLRIVKDTDIVDTVGSAATGMLKKTVGANYALVHSRRFSGVLEIDGDQGTGRPLPALCLNPTSQTFFVTTATMTKVSDAPEACLIAGGFFVAPSKSLEWVQSLSAVAPIHSHLPWPQPTGVALTTETPQNALTQKAAWVALKGATTAIDDYLKAPTAGALDFYQLLTGAVAAKIDTSPAKKLCKINDQSFAVKNSCDAGETQMTTANYHAEAKDRYSYLAIMRALKAEYSVSGSTTWVGNIGSASGPGSPAL